MKKINILILLSILLFIVFALFSSCQNITISKGSFVIVSGSENEPFEQILKDYASQNNYSLEMKYIGSVDMTMGLKNGSFDADAIWSANSMWISMGDKNKKIKYTKSIMTSPIVFGIKKPIAKNLGFVNNNNVGVKDILKEINNKKLNFLMTSASQSNSGACAYLGFIYSLLDEKEVITTDDLKNSDLKKDLKSLLSGVSRSSGSSGWLKNLFLQGEYDAMVNYESVIIETNQELIKQGKEPLYLVYPNDGIILSDSPLGYFDKGDKKKEEFFKSLQEYLLSKEIQQKIESLGRRTGIGGSLQYDNPQVFNKDWGVKSSDTLAIRRMPSENVIHEALSSYQNEFKKPSFTIFCLDYSGSMEGSGIKNLREAMILLLDNKKASEYFLQSTPEDKIIVMPFSGDIIDTWKVNADNQDNLNALIDKINDQYPRGSTDIYSPVISALDIISKEYSDKYITSIVLMTDGESNVGKKYSDLEDKFKKTKLDIPIFSIMFGSASKSQLEPISTLSRALVFNGKDDLIDAFKKVRGYN